MTDYARRAVLRAGLLGPIVGSSGCLTQLRTVVNRDGPPAITLTVKVVPYDSDPRATRLAQTLADNLSKAGVRTEVTPMVPEELYRAVLVNHDFDLYVAQFPTEPDPDVLRALFHSRFNTESGWQNPVGFSDIGVDRDLEEQVRQSPGDRRRTLADLQRSLAEKQPVSVVAFPDEIRGYRPATFSGWNQYPLGSPLGYLALDSGPTGVGRPTLHVTVTDGRITRNLNPLTVEFRSTGLFTGLLYDSLCRWVDGDVVPWLAESVTWEDGSFRVALRDGVRWHDGEALTADDVAFTYRFYADTALGETDQPVPAPRYRGRSSLVEGVSVLDDATLRFVFDGVTERIARRALVLPVLPEHVWRSRTNEANVIGVIEAKSVTEAVVTSNIPPVGSGPLVFDRAVADESLVLARNDDHFLERASEPGDVVVDRFGVSYDRLVASVVPSAQAAVELVVAGEADATATPSTAAVVPTIGRAEDVALRVRTSRSFYHVGYNNRRPPLRNTQFRRVVARLLDKAAIVEDVFDGYATPAATPLAGTDWEPDALRWRGEDPVLPFLGSEGTVDEERARDAFVEAGYRYEGGTLVGA